MHTTAWQSLQLPPFQGVFYDSRSTPLQIQNFTSESYEFIKRRERKKAEKRKTIDVKQKSKEQNVEEGNPSGCQVEFGPCYPGSLDRALTGSKVLNQARRVAHDSCAVQSYTGMQDLYASPTSTPISVLETQATPQVDGRAPRSLSGVSPAASADNEGTASAERQTLLFCDMRNSPFDGAHGISSWGDDLGTTSVQLEELACDPGRHAQATRPQAVFVCGDTEGLPDDLEIRPSPSPSTCFSISQSTTAVTSIQCRADDDQPSKEEVDVEERNMTTATPIVAALSSQSNQRRRGAVFNSWSNIEELLLHLRDVSQLGWQSIVPYFPGTLLSLVKRRYRQLSQREISRSSSEIYPTPGRNTVIPASTLSIVNQANARIHRASFRRPAKTVDRKLNLSRRKRTPKSNNTVKVVANQAPTRVEKRCARRGKKHGWDYIPVPSAEDRRRHDHRATINEDNIIPGSGGRSASRCRRSERR